nr:MAG TPA: hypothetical protein [Caudoviricetes sp.]
MDELPCLAGFSVLKLTFNMVPHIIKAYQVPGQLCSGFFYSKVGIKNEYTR